MREKQEGWDVFVLL
jgi:hypothetical protein